MTKKVSQPLTEHYIVPARQLSGTRDEVLAQIDELILGLTGLRQLVSLHGPTPAEAPRRKLHLVKGFLRVLFVVGIALWASSAQGQTGASGSTPPAAQEQEGTQTQKAADNPWAGLTFGATIETFYQYHWNRPPNRVLPLRAYDTRSNTFAIQQAALVIDAIPDIEAGRRFGGRVDLQFGMATDTVQGNPGNEPRPEAYRHLWQPYGAPSSAAIGRANALPWTARSGRPATDSEHGARRWRVVVRHERRRLSGGRVLLALGMVVLGVATFVALVAFVELCDRV